jgi:soluble lytic murein transglycosylase-like protein
MKKLILFLCLVSNCNALTLEQVIDAIAIVESGGDVNAFNRKENAIGLLQIRPIMVKDYNRIYGTSFDHATAWNAEASKMIAMGIFKHYTKNIDRPTAKHLAFIWNGGGSAWVRVDAPKDDRKQRQLEIYWGKVVKNLP